MKKSLFIVISALIMLGAFCSCGSEGKKVQTDDKVEVSDEKKSNLDDIDEENNIADDQVDNNKDFVLTSYLSRMLEEDLENYKDHYYECETPSAKDQLFYQFGKPFFEVLNSESFEFPEDEQVMEQFWQKLEEASENMDSRWEWVSKGCQTIYKNQIEKKNLKTEVPAFSKLRPADPENDRDLPLITCLYDDVTYERIPCTTVFPIEDLDGNVVDKDFYIKDVEPELYVQDDMVCQIYTVVTISDGKQYRVSGRYIYLYSASSSSCLYKEEFGSYYINYNKTVNYGKWLDSDMNGKVPCCNDEKIMEQEVGEMYLSHNFWEKTSPVKLYVEEKDKKLLQHDFRFELYAGGTFTVSARSAVENSQGIGLDRTTDESKCESISFFELSGNKLSLIMTERILKPGEDREESRNVFYDYEFSKTENYLQLELKATIRSVFNDFVYRTGVWIPEDYYDEHYNDTLKKTCSKIYTAPIPYCWNLEGNWIMFYESDEGDNFWL